MAGTLSGLDRPAPPHLGSAKVRRFGRSTSICGSLFFSQTGINAFEKNVLPESFFLLRSLFLPWPLRGFSLGCEKELLFFPPGQRGFRGRPPFCFYFPFLEKKEEEFAPRPSLSKTPTPYYFLCGFACWRCPFFFFCGFLCPKIRTPFCRVLFQFLPVLHMDIQPPADVVGAAFPLPPCSSLVFKVFPRLPLERQPASFRPPYSIKPTSPFAGGTRLSSGTFPFFFLSGKGHRFFSG